MTTSFGVAVQGNNTETDTLALETKVGRKFTVFRAYQFWSDTVIDKHVQWAAARGMRPIVSVHPFEPDSKTNPATSIKWKDIAAGLHDARIKAIAAEVKAFGLPFGMSFHHEPENELPPGYEGYCGDSPAEFTAAFDHFFDVLYAQGATNATRVLSLMGTTYRGTYNPRGKRNAHDWTPQRYDVVATDGYNRAQCIKSPWMSFDDVFGSAHRYSVEQGKPLIIQECGSVENKTGLGGSKGAWFDEATQLITSWGNVDAFSYSDVFSKQFGCSYLIDSSPNSLTRFKAMAHAPVFT